MKRKRNKERAKKVGEEATLNAPSRPAAATLTLRKKLLFSTLMTVLFFATLELALATAGFKPLIVEEDPYVGFASQIPLFVEKPGPDGQMELVTAENKTRWFNPQKFPKKKGPDTLRVFCLGGSTTFGHPYDDNTSFAGWLRELLPETDTAQKWEVINCGGISYASYRVANLLEELVEYEPDLFIIYSGHNEFLEARTYSNLIETPGFLLELGSLCSRTRTYAAMSRVIHGRRGTTTAAPPDPQKQVLSAEVNTLLDSAVGPVAYHRDDKLREDIRQHFDFNLRRMIKRAQSAGARVILVTPASNLSHCSPFKSEHRADLDASALGQWETFYHRAAERHRASSNAEALRAIEQAVRIDPRHAEGLYLRGQILLALRRIDEAKQSLIAARDEDVCTLRAPTEFVEVVRNVARDTRTPLIDFVAQVEKTSPQGIPGESLFLDHVHPTIDGYRDIAVAIVPVLRDMGLLHKDAELTQQGIAAAKSRVMSRVDNKAHGVALRNLSKVLSWAGKKEDADRLALRALELTPDDAESVYQAGNAQVRLGQFDEAIRLFERALQMNPQNSATIHASLGYAYGLKGDEAKCIEHYREALRINPGFADIHHNLATILEQRGELDAAIGHYRQAIASNPQHYFSQYRLGLIYARQERWSDARIQFDKALKLDPNSINAHFCMGQVLANQGDRTGAREHFDWILRRNPNHSDTLAELRQLDRDAR